MSVASALAGHDPELLLSILHELRLRGHEAPATPTPSTASTATSPSAIGPKHLALADLLKPRPEHERAHWRVVSPQSKFRASCGFPLVSPSMQLGQLEVRFIFEPGQHWAWLSSRGKHRRGEVSSQFGSLQLKFGSSTSEPSEPVRFYFCVGKFTLGPFGASSCASEKCELPEDWGRMVRDGVLHVSAELR
ncbi:unnamed protein product [Effrenium voratum]|nr:unnamed protein product [Effrenium voratum]